MSYCVYVHTNKRNGKRYVGLTSKRPDERWCNGHGYASNKPFYNAIKKYGWDAGFDHAVVAVGLTADEAAQLERALIREYDSDNTAHGYNLTHGGFGYYGVQDMKRTLPDLPPYGHVKNNPEMKMLFDRLVSIALGGYELKETVALYENGKKICESVTSRITPPNIEAIDSILHCYENEPELSELIARLKEIKGE